MHLELRKGAWATMKDTDDITSGDRKAFYKRLQKEAEGDQYNNSDRSIAFLLDSWSFNLPVPKWNRETKDFDYLSSLDELSAKDLDILAIATIKLLKEITPNFDPDPSPVSPTSPSGD